MEGLLSVNANQKTAMMKAISDGLAAGDGEQEPGPEEWSAPAARLADLVSPEAVDRMLADADEAGVSVHGPDGLLKPADQDGAGAGAERGARPTTWVM